jgi:hypothetical protein
MVSFSCGWHIDLIFSVSWNNVTYIFWHLAFLISRSVSWLGLNICFISMSRYRHDMSSLISGPAQCWYCSGRKISWETWCLNYQGQRHYLRTMQIIALGPLQYQHWAGPDMRLDISWRYRDIEKSFGLWKMLSHWERHFDKYLRKLLTGQLSVPVSYMRTALPSVSVDDNPWWFFCDFRTNLVNISFP